MNNKKEVLDSIQGYIANFDNKATSLLTAIGVIFGFSLFSIGELGGKVGAIKTLIIVIGVLYLLTFTVSIISLVIIIFPRKKWVSANLDHYDYNHYYEDIYKKRNNKDFAFFINEESNEDVLLDQIKQCSRIAHIKSLLLKVSVVSIICMSITLVTLIVLLFL